jgi:hypothetical protein
MADLQGFTNFHQAQNNWHRLPYSTQMILSCSLKHDTVITERCSWYGRHANFVILDTVYTGIHS